MLPVNRYKLLGLIVLLSPAFSLAANETTLSLNHALEEALKNNPNLAQIQTRAQAIASIPSQVGSLPDPMLHFNAMNLPTDSFDFDQEPMTQLQLGVSQAFPFPGKRSLKKTIGELNATAANAQLEEVKLQLIKNVRTLWWQMFYLDRSLEIIDKNRVLLKQFIDIARAKYEVGGGLQQDVLLAQLELSKLLDKQIELKATRKNQTIMFNKLLGKPTETKVLLSTPPDLTLPAIAKKSLLEEKAYRHRPLLLKHRQQLDAAIQQLKLSKKAYYPDFTLGAFYGERQGNNPGINAGERSDFLSLKLGLKLPLYAASKQSKAVDQRTAEQLEKEYALQDASNEVVAQINQALTNYQKASEQFSLFKNGIIPQAQQTVASMLAGYRVNKVDFLNLVRSQITLFNYETRYWLALSTAKQSLAELIAAVGEETIYE